MWFNSGSWQAQLGLFLAHIALSTASGQSIPEAVLNISCYRREEADARHLGHASNATDDARLNAAHRSVWQGTVIEASLLRLSQLS
jgi:hypothetical protein